MIIDVSKLQKPPEGAKIIRVTERNSFRQCRRKWNYERNERLRLIILPVDGRSFGTAMHAAIEVYYKGIIDGYGYTSSYMRAVKELGNQEDNFSTSEDYDLAKKMLDSYLWYVCDDGYVPLLSETDFYAQLPGTDIWIGGKVDVVVEDHRGKFVRDMKNFSRIPSDAEMQWDDQMPIYLWLLKQNGIRCQGGMYDIIFKKAPTEPQLVNSKRKDPVTKEFVKELSRRKDILTTREVYRAAVLKYGFDMADYEDHIASIQDMEFVYRVFISPSSDTIDSYGEYLAAEAKDMLRTELPIFPMQSYKCAYCDYAILCACVTGKGDVAFTRDGLYMKKLDGER